MSGIVRCDQTAWCADFTFGFTAIEEGSIYGLELRRSLTVWILYQDRSGQDTAGSHM